MTNKKFVGSALKSGSVGDGKQDIFFMVPNLDLNEFSEGLVITSVGSEFQSLMTLWL